MQGRGDANAHIMATSKSSIILVVWDVEAPLFTLTYARRSLTTFMRAISVLETLLRSCAVCSFAVSCQIVVHLVSADSADSILNLFAPEQFRTGRGSTMRCLV